MPIVSVVIPTCGRPDMLQQAVRSVVNQTFQDFEIIVVLNGAASQTADAATRWSSNNKVRAVTMARACVSTARNVGVASAQGDWIAFLDDDDLWLPEKLEVQLAAAHQTNADLITCNFELCDENGDFAQSGGLISRPHGLTFAEALMLGNYVSGGSAAVVKTTALRSLDGFDPKLDGHEDWDMWRRLSWRHRIHYVDQVLVKYRRHAGNKTADPLLMLEAATRHFVKLLDDSPPDLSHMFPAATERFCAFVRQDRRHAQDMTGDRPRMLAAELQHLAKILQDAPPKLHHMLPSVKQRYLERLASEIAGQGIAVHAIIRRAIAHNVVRAVGLTGLRAGNRLTFGWLRRIWPSLGRWVAR
jgi:hypothetical protein